MKLDFLLNRNYLRRFSYVLVGLFFLGLLFYFYGEWNNKLEKDISLKIGSLESSLTDFDLDDEEQFEKLREIAKNFNDIYLENPSKNNGLRALYLSAMLDFSLKDYAESKDKFSTLLAGNSKHYLAANAYYFIGLADEADKKYNDAIEWLEEFDSKFPNHYLKSEVFLTIGRIYTQLKDYQLAKNFYDEIIINGKGENFSAFAREKIDFLRINGFITNQ